MEEASRRGKPQPLAVEPGRSVESPAPANAGLLMMARRALVASLGAVAITIDEVNDLLARLVERGEIAETDISRFVTEYVNRNSAREENAGVNRLVPKDRATLTIADSVEVILERLNVPTHADIEELSRKISLLNEKVTLLKQRGGQLPAGSASIATALAESEGASPAMENGDR